MTILLLAALVPPIFLMVKIYQMDKVEREPVRLVLLVFFLGAASTAVAALLEGVFGDLLAGVLPEKSVLFQLIYYFLVVAWTEEGVKHFALKHPTWNNPEMDYRFDGIIYSVAAALGFAAAENIGYVFSFGLEVALGRALTAIPGHCIFGIFMGYYYGSAKFFAVRGMRARAARYQRLSMIVPILLHGFYDFSATQESDLWSLLFFAFIILLDIFAIVSIRKYAKQDEGIYEYHINRMGR